MRQIVLALTFSICCCQSYCLTAGQCEPLGFPPDSYQVGNNLTYCQTSSYQCCNHSYLSSAADTASDKLQKGLRQQLDDVKKSFSATVNLTTEYFNYTLVHQWIASGKIPNPLNMFNVLQLTEIYQDLINTFNSNVTNNLNITAFVDTVINSVGTTASLVIGSGNQTTQNCAYNHIKSSVNSTGHSLLVSILNELRNGLSVLVKSQVFLVNYIVNTNFTFPTNCTIEFVAVNFCPRCMREIPPVCSNTCGALIQGCYSPYYTVLNEELDVLFNVSSQLVTLMNANLRTLFTREVYLFDQDSLTQLQQICGVDIPVSHVAPTNSTVQLQLIDEKTLKNPVERFYNSEGVPVVCRPKVAERDFCANRTSDSVRVKNCSLNTACTSDCKCFNGQTENVANTDEFRGYGIDEQVANPVINLSTSELESIARSIGSPIREFLARPDINGTFPSGVVIPPKPVPPDPTTTNNGDSTTDDDDGGSVTFNYKRNFILLIGMTFIAILFIY